MHKVRLAALVVSGCLCAADAIAQAPPDLSRQQRDLLSVLVAAVDRGPTAGEPADHAWLTHILRASDGSHYVAFSMTPPAAALSDAPMVIYVRLATGARQAETTLAERSIVREWLSGSRTDPRLLPRKGGVAVGEMPPMGAGAIGARGAPSVGSADLQALDLQRERARQRAADDEKQRRATLEGSAAAAADRLPFEDFEIGRAATFADGTRAIQRALTAGPGTYELSVAWVDAAVPAAKARPQVARHRLQLGAAGATEFGVSSVIIADRVSVRPVPYGPLEQRAHPYTIGLTEIVPARDTVLTPARSLSVAFQIINAVPSPSGKPDVRVEMRLARLVGAREEPVAALSPLTYNETTLPPDFDLRQGHPVIAAMSAPLATVPRGNYRLQIAAEDRLGGTVAAGDARFTVVGTPQTLLAEAPALGPRFDRASALAPDVVGVLVEQLTPVGLSPALATALQSARVGRYGDLLIDAAVPATEQAIRMVLTGLALLSLGDLGALAQFERAQQMQAPPGPTLFLLGSARAMQNRDRDAIAAWTAARSAGFTPPTLDRLIAEAHLRQRDYARAAESIGNERAADAARTRTYAATRIGTGRFDDAIGTLEARLATEPDDAALRWLLLHALYADFVGGNRGRADRAAAEASRYIDAKGPHAALASEWLQVMTKQP